MCADKASIGARLRAARKAVKPHGLTVDAMAEALRDAATDRDRQRLPKLADLRRMIRGWEAGEHTPGARYRLLYTVALDTTEAELFGPQTVAQPSPSSELWESPHALGMVCLPHANGRPVDASFVELIRETNQTLVRLDAQWSGYEVFPLALRVFRTAHHKLGAGDYASGIERDLIAATGETGEIAAWLAFDADEQSVSRQLIHEALMLSRQAGDRDMELFELTHLAMQSLYLRRPAEALRIANDALDRRLAPRVAALFDIRRGRALAQRGDEQGAFDALNRAGAALTGSINARDPYWTWWVDETELTRHKATAYDQLGRWRRAIPLREQIITGHQGSYPYGKLDLAQLLNALVQVRDWRRAEDIITEIASLANSIAPGRTANLLRRTFEQIGRVDGASSTVIDAAHDLRRLLGDEPSRHSG
jgi:tetratricopeptide (TPR) repeat protein